MYSLLGFYWNWNVKGFFPKGHPRRCEVTFKYYVSTFLNFTNSFKHNNTSKKQKTLFWVPL